MAELTTWCRACPTQCGLLVTSAEGRLQRAEGDPEHPLSRGFSCAHGRSAPAGVAHPDRVLSVLRADGFGGHRPGSWELAQDDIGARIQAAVRAAGWSSVAVVVGGAASNCPRLWRSLAAVRRVLGPVEIFDPQQRWSAPMRQASRLVTGRPSALRADLARARHLLLLGGNQQAEGWPPGHAGQDLPRRLQGPLRRRLRLTVADPRRSSLTERADEHLPIRPGTELYFLLGMAAAMIRSGWLDRRHVRERTLGLEALAAALEPWTPARAGELCGLDASAINAEAMRLSRAPTAVILPTQQAFGTPWSTLTAWMVLVIQALTSNLLEPGGLYAHPGIPGVVPTAARADTALGRAARRLRVLICVDADPFGALPINGGLDCVVSIGRHMHATARAAHWVLPAAHPLEEPALGFGDSSGRHWLQWSSGLAVPPGDCRPASELIEALLAAGDPVRPGRKLAVDQHAADVATLGAVAESLGVPVEEIEASAQPRLTRNAEQARGFDGGPVDRACWAVDHPDGRLQLAPPPLLRALAAHRAAPSGGAWPLRLISGARRDPSQGPWERYELPGPARVGLHPRLGFRADQRVCIRSPHGSTEAIVELDGGLQPQTVDLPQGGYGNPLALVDPAHLDRWAETLWSDGQPCRVEPCEG
jgi:anaerobic selenocysteine-containing dehydrogenase